MTLNPADGRYAVVVTLPAGGPAGIDPVRRLGPYTLRSTADLAAMRLQNLLPSSAPDNTTVTVAAYDDTLPHHDPADLPDDRDNLAAAIMGAASDVWMGGGWDFPDLYARLAADRGIDEAGQWWAAACEYVGYLEDLARQEKEADEARAERAAKVRPLVQAARSGRWSTIYTEPVIDAAAELLADMLDAAAAHGVTIKDLAAVTSLPTACLDVTAANVASGRNIPRPGAAPPEPPLDVLAGQLCASGVRDVRRERPHWVTFAIAGDPRRRRIHLFPGGGWRYTVDGATDRDIKIYATADAAGAQAVAATIARIAAGDAHDPLEAVQP